MGGDKRDVWVPDRDDAHVGKRVAGCCSGPRRVDCRGERFSAEKVRTNQDALVRDGGQTVAVDLAVYSGDYTRNSVVVHSATGRNL